MAELRALDEPLSDAELDALEGFLASDAVPQDCMDLEMLDGFLTAIVSGPEADILVGNALPLRNIPPGTTVHNIELKPGKGAQMARSAGAQAQLVAKEGDYALLKLPSGETRKVLVDCMATVGQVGNTDHENVSIGKAGRTRWLGRRPTNRGVVMNPVDHPHGGGEGKTSGGRHPVTPWGQPTRGYKTRNNKRTDKFIVSRNKKK